LKAICDRCKRAVELEARIYRGGKVERRKPARKRP
jgi:hypothetical protein